MFCHVLFFSLFFIDVYGKIYFKEEFVNGSWEQNWISSKHSDTDWGKFILSPGKYFGDKEISKGVQTSEDGKFYGLSTKFEPFSNKDKVLVIQFTVRHAQNIKCGGGYIKLFDCSLKPENLHSYTPYLIMFGPDICGSNKKIQVIFNYNDRKLKIKREIKCKDDYLTHLYTLIVKPDNTYVIKIDNKIEIKGQLEEDWDFFPRRVKDPKVIRSGDKLKSNPNEISNENTNPDHTTDPSLYIYDEICGVGFDIWQVKAGTIFDNILITDDELEAEDHGVNTWGVIMEKEKKNKIKIIKAAAEDDVIERGDGSSKKTIQHDEF